MAPAAPLGLRFAGAVSALLKEKMDFFLSDIVFKSPKLVCQLIVHQTTAVTAKAKLLHHVI